MTILEVESWKVKPGREKEHKEAIHNWMAWVKDHRELFPEWKSLQYVEKYIAGEETERHVMIWEYDSLADFEAYKARRKDYEAIRGLQEGRPIPHGRIRPHNNEGRGLEATGKRPVARVGS